GETRVSPLLGVEGRNPDESVHADLPLEVAVGVLALDGDRRRLDPRLLARLQIDDLGLEAGALAPAEVHSHEDLRPVLRLGAAGAGMNRHDRVLRVVRPAEHDLEPEVVERLSDPRDAFLDLGRDALVAGLARQFEEHTELFGLRHELSEACDRPRQLRPLPRQFLGASAVVPEARRPHLRLDDAEALLLHLEVKDASADRPGDGRSRRGPAGVHSAWRSARARATRKSAPAAAPATQ